MGYSDELYEHMLRQEYLNQQYRAAEWQSYSDSVDWWNEQCNIEYEGTQQYLISFDNDED